MTESATQRLDALFRLRYGQSLELNALSKVDAPRGVNFVSRAMGNNGVTARVAYSGSDTGKAGEITVALSGNGVLSTFVQPEDFVTGFHVMILTAKDPSMSTVEKLWWARCVWENRYRFSYGRQANRTLGALHVPASKPSWVDRTAMPTMDGLAQRASGATAFSVPTGEAWADFRLDALFEIRKGKRLTKADMLPGTTPFIGATEKNNGVTAFVGQDPLHPGGVLTVSYNGSVGQVFFQPRPFWATDDVNVLYPLDPSNRWALLFIAAVIKHVRTRYTYGYKWTLTRMQATTIRLPVDATGAPDYAYMERVMRGLPFSAAVEATAVVTTP